MDRMRADNIGFSKYLKLANSLPEETELPISWENTNCLCTQTILTISNIHSLIGKRNSVIFQMHDERYMYRGM